MFNPWKNPSKGGKLSPIKMAEKWEFCYKLIAVEKRKCDSIKTCLL